MDHRIGLKENVIIGKLIPAGSGLSMYRQVNPREEETEAPRNGYAAVAAAVQDQEAAPADSKAEETALEDAFEEGAILPDAGEEDEVLSITLDN